MYVLCINYNNYVYIDNVIYVSCPSTHAFTSVRASARAYKHGNNMYVFAHLAVLLLTCMLVWRGRRWRGMRVSLARTERERDRLTTFSPAAKVGRVGTDFPQRIYDECSHMFSRVMFFVAPRRLGSATARSTEALPGRGQAPSALIA